MLKPVGLLLAACALLASFLVHDRETHRGVIVEDVRAAAHPSATPVVAAAAEAKKPLPPLAGPPPADAKARAKFRKAPAGLVDLVAYANAFVNSRMTGVTDQDHYGIADLWVMAPSDGAGDCEDYALTKIFVLGQLDFPIASDAKLVMVVVHEKKGDEGEGHAILAVRLTDGEVMYLDNNYDEPMTRRELTRAGYEFFDWRA